MEAFTDKLDWNKDRDIITALLPLYLEVKHKKGVVLPVWEDVENQADKNGFNLKCLALQAAYNALGCGSESCDTSLKPQCIAIKLAMKALGCGGADGQMTKCDIVKNVEHAAEAAFSGMSTKTKDQLRKRRWYEQKKNNRTEQEIAIEKARKQLWYQNNKERLQKLRKTEEFKQKLRIQQNRWYYKHRDILRAKKREQNKRPASIECDRQYRERNRNVLKTKTAYYRAYQKKLKEARGATYEKLLGLGYFCEYRLKCMDLQVSTLYFLLFVVANKLMHCPKPDQNKEDDAVLEEGYDSVDAGRTKAKKTPTPEPKKNNKRKPPPDKVDEAEGRHHHKHHRHVEPDSEVPELEFIDVHEKQFTFQKTFTLQPNEWNFEELPFIDLNTKEFMLSNVVRDPSTNAYPCWAVDEITIRIPDMPISAGFDHISLAVTDDKGPPMMKILAVPDADLANADKAITRTHTVIDDNGKYEDGLAFIMAENKKASKKTMGLHYLTDLPAHVLCGGSNGTMYVLDPTKNDLNPGTSYYYSKTRSVGGGVAPIGTWPTATYTTGVGELKGKQALGANSTSLSPENPQITIRTPSRFFAQKENMFPIFSGKGPHIAIQTSNFQHRVRKLDTSSKPVVQKFTPTCTVRGMAKLVWIKDNELSKYMIDKFWRDAQRIPSDVPIIQPGMQLATQSTIASRWTSPTDIEALKYCKSLDPIKVMSALGRFDHIFRGWCFSDPQEGKNLKKRISYPEEENNQVQLYMTALRTSGGGKKEQMMDWYY